MSTTPAFSPGPCTTNFPRVGSRLRCTLLDLYEQCSLHITLKMPSSVMLGSRPRIFWMRAYSSGVRPCSAATSGVTRVSVCNIRILGPLVGPGKVVHHFPHKAHAVSKILHRNTLVIAVHALVVVLRDGERLEPVAQDALIAEEMRVGEACVDRLHHAGARIERVDRVLDRRVERRIG